MIKYKPFALIVVPLNDDGTVPAMPPQSAWTVSILEATDANLHDKLSIACVTLGYCILHPEDGDRQANDILVQERGK